MKLKISPRAEKELNKIPKIHQIAIVKKIRSFTLSENLNKEKLSGYKDMYRVRVGQYRIVYRERPNEFFIVLIGHRKDIYRMLHQFFK
jgi:Cytotoxic translational repressor of toxin-antitoxin stability system